MIYVDSSINQYFDSPCQWISVVKIPGPIRHMGPGIFFV